MVEEEERGSFKQEVEFVWSLNVFTERVAWLIFFEPVVLNREKR